MQLEFYFMKDFEKWAILHRKEKNEKLKSYYKTNTEIAFKTKYNLKRNWRLAA